MTALFVVGRRDCRGLPTHLGAVPGDASEPPTRAAVLEGAAGLIFEGGGGSPEQPYWPKGESGITWGVGWDAGQNTEAALNADWGELPPQDLALLRTAVGKCGVNARELLDSLKKINIPSDTALKVFRGKS